MRENDELKDELKGIAPFLSAQKRVEPFSAPIGYFDTFPAHVQTRLQGRRKRADFLAALFSSRWAPILAGCCLFFLVAGFFYWGSGPVVVQQETYSDVLLDHVDEDVLLEAYLDTDPKKKSKDIEDFILEQTDESFLTEEI